MRPHHTAPPQPLPDGPPPGGFRSELVGPFEVTLPSEVDAPVAARTALVVWMAGHVAETMLADAQLLVGELVANSVRHADAADDAVVSVRAEIRGDALRMEVQDRGRTNAIARRAPDREHGGGFGLHLVELLSRRWGVNRDAGTRVWAELDVQAMS
jgi:serine/threonine-protein kinase RsbW